MVNQLYEIQINGHLSQDWASWLEGMQMCSLENGNMILSGTLADQAALIGVLNKLNRLNLTILSINKTDRKDGGQTVENRSAVNQKAYKENE